MILAIAFGRTMTAGEVHREFKVPPTRVKIWARNGWVQTYSPTQGRIRYSRDEIIRMLAFGEDWAGRKVQAGRGDGRRLVEQAATLTDEDLERLSADATEKRWRF